MLNAVPLVAHGQSFVTPAEAWGAWNPLALAALGSLFAGLVLVTGRSARHRASPWRRRSLLGSVVALAIALGSPLEAMAAALASAHMVQHILLVLVAAPLLVVGAPMATVLAAGPARVRGIAVRLARNRGISNMSRVARVPLVAWFSHAAALWLWHSAVLYDMALHHPWVHAVEHLTFLGTGMLFWSTVLGPHRRYRVSGPAAVLVVFTMGLQSVFLSALLTFSPTAWYGTYAISAPTWGLDPLTDQQLAGLIMWIPAGFVYFGTAITVLVTWLDRSHREISGFVTS